MSETIHIRSTGEAWPAQSGIALLKFEHSLDVYWLEYVPEGGKFKKAIITGAASFAQAHGMDPQFAFINPVPIGAEEGIEIQDLMIIQADWVQPRFVAIGRGGLELIQEEFQSWRRR